MAGKKGRSGRKKMQVEALNYLSEEVKSALERISNIAQNPKAPYAVRLEADKILVEHAMGKPSQRREVTGEDGDPIRMVMDMTDEQLRNIAAGRR